MNIFLDTADIQAIQKWHATGLIDGITTNPTSLSKVGGNPVSVIRSICEILADGHVSVEVTEQSAEAIYKQAHEIAKLASNVIVKVPCHPQYVQVIHKLVQDGIRLNITLSFSLAQAVYMAKLGVFYISPFVARAEDIGMDSVNILHEIRTVYDHYRFQTKVLAASLRTPAHVHHAFVAGADVVTLAPDLLQKTLEHPLSDSGIAQFITDWKKLSLPKFP